MLEIEFHFKLTRKPKAKKITVQAELEQWACPKASKFLALAIKIIVK